MKKPVVLVVGAGNVGLRVVRRLRRRARVIASARNAARARVLQSHGVRTSNLDLDRVQTFRALRRLRIDAVIYLAPPPAAGARDLRLRRLLASILPAASRRLGFVYVSTSGVYGDCAGERVDEHRPVRPASARARRRVDAERALERAARRNDWRATVLRAPGIYDADHLPVERIRRGVPAIVASEDSYTNHIHADDLAAMCVAALRSKRSFRIYNASDDTSLKMGDWFHRVAQTFGLQPPPRVARAQARALVGPMLWSFMRESRRLSNARIKRELRVRLAWPTVDDFLKAVDRP